MSKETESDSPIFAEKQRGIEILESLLNHLMLPEVRKPIEVEGKELPIAWVNDCATAIRKYLDGDAKTLEEAFEIKRSVGRPKHDARRKEEARRIRDRKGKVSWTTFARENPDMDLRTAQKVLREFRAQLDSEEAWQELIDGMDESDRHL